MVSPLVSDRDDRRDPDDAPPEAAPGERSVDDAPRVRQVRLLQAATLGAVLAGLAWVVTVVLSADRGLDLTDESLYLLSYRWWDVNLDAFSGVQYVYGPVFQLLGYDIALLRVARLVVTVAAHAWFAHAFVGWLRVRRPHLPRTRWVEAAGATAVAACGGITYSWLPLSPGYNDLALACALVLAGGVLRVARDAALDRPVAAWVPVLLGIVVVEMALAKWSSAALVVAGTGTVLVIVMVLARQGALRLLRVVGLGLVGVAIAVAVMQFLLVPLQRAIPPMVEVNSAVAGSTNSPSALLARYHLGASTLGHAVLAQYWPLLVAAVAVPVLDRVRALRPLAIAVAALALAVSVGEVLRRDGTLGGTVNLPVFTVTIFAPLVAVALVALTHAALSAPRAVRSLRSGRGRAASADAGGGDGGAGAARTDRTSGPDSGGWRVRAEQTVLVTMLLLVPVVVSVGTGNFLQYIAVLGLASWAAVAVLLLTAPGLRSGAARVLLAGLVAGLVASSAAIAVDGLWNRPYRTTGHDASSADAGVPALTSVRVSPSDARFYADLRERLLPLVREPGRAIMPFDRMPGIAYLLDARPVGESWYAATDPARSVAGVRRACAAEGGPWWGDRAPIILFNRPITDRERSAFADCGIDFARYERFVVRHAGQEIQVYTPPGEDSP